ncbi:hypothetical protein KW794_02455 [Candidatus Saccharibacteria bacterium]|nr:hypothetical protein [Candidatus Saccharibacteria bacterium]
MAPGRFPKEIPEIAYLRRRISSDPELTEEQRESLLAEWSIKMKEGGKLKEIFHDDEERKKRGWNR